MLGRAHAMLGRVAPRPTHAWMCGQVRVRGGHVCAVAAGWRGEARGGRMKAWRGARAQWWSEVRAGRMKAWRGARAQWRPRRAVA
eukprot:4948711-Prymnesium_polylepis.1